MPTVCRELRLDVSAEAAWDACLALLRTPDPRRGITERRCEPDPPRRGGLLVTVVAGRELRSRIVELDPPRLLATAAEDDGPSVQTRLEVTPGATGSTVLLTSDATTALTGRPRLLRVLDAVILGRSQRRSARATLRRLRELVSGRDSR